MGSSTDSNTNKNHGETLGETLSKINPAVPFVGDRTQTTHKPNPEATHDAFANVDHEKVEEKLLKEKERMADTLSQTNPAVPFAGGSGGQQTHKTKTVDGVPIDHDPFAHVDATKKQAGEKLNHTDEPANEKLRQANDLAPVPK